MTVLFTKEQCVNCDATKTDLDALNVEYQTINLTQEPEHLDKLIALGFRSAPVVLPGNGAKPWAGYKPEKIQEAFA